MAGHKTRAELDATERAWRVIGGLAVHRGIALSESVQDALVKAMTVEFLAAHAAGRAEVDQERMVLLRQAQPHVCSLLCPSVWKTGEEPPHSDLCRVMQKAYSED